MEYDENFLDVKYIMMNVFLLNIRPNILDVSYSIESHEINIQVVLLENTELDSLYLKELIYKLKDFAVKLNVIFISKLDYNSNNGNWIPTRYKWQSIVVLSKSGI
ncbi:hypothetical protein TH53_12220 [Pedobacter lusitanus]|uniref:Uncharacterized protein n=1 Tax=Pedobacter lusitanus TaxID=1503925 RepID=A0A0D0F5N4_9SPHI|nr:hypothetical protein TH53_12220 [Pedobacter lusitanus]